MNESSQQRARSGGPCDQDGGHTGEPARHNVLLFTLDAVRADRIGMRTPQGCLTPTLDRLAARGTRFANAITAANTTDPSHASLLTSTYPQEHGVLLNAVRFAGAVPTLAQILSRNGYATMGAVSVEHLSSYFGLNRGFDTYINNSRFDRLYYGVALRPALNDTLIRMRRWRHIFRRSHWRLGERTTGAALRWLTRPRARPFFAWIHYFDAHNYPALDGYDVKVRYVDEQIGRVIDTLAELGELCNTIVIATSDHGELLQTADGKLLTHGRTLLDSELRVPLVVSADGEPRTATVTSQVRTIDIAPTILDMVGIPAPSSWRGTSLLPWMRGEHHHDLAAFALNCGEGKRARCIRTGSWKYVRDEVGGDRLYDLAHDPTEACNVIVQHSKLAAELRQTLRELWVAGGSTEYTDRESVAIEDMLRDLGYLD